MAVLAEKGHIPRGLRTVRPNSPRYEEWEALVYESSWSRKYRREREMQDEVDQCLDEMEERGRPRTPVAMPKALLTKLGVRELLSSRVVQDDPAQSKAQPKAPVPVASEIDPVVPTGTTQEPTPRDELTETRRPTRRWKVPKNLREFQAVEAVVLMGP